MPVVALQHYTVTFNLVVGCCAHSPLYAVNAFLTCNYTLLYVRVLNVTVTPLPP